MRILFTFMCVLALSVMGCGETAGTGGSGGDGGAGGDGGSGGATPECQSPEDCDDDNECTDDTCLAGVCEFMPVPDPTGPDEPGDPPGEGTTCGYYMGTCEGGSCAGTFACTEAGIREAIAAGAGPHTFACNGATTVVTEAEIFIDNDVILDGEGQLTLDGDGDHAVFVSPQNLNDPPATAELRGFRVTGGPGFALMSVGQAIYIAGDATLTLTDSTVSENEGDGVGVDGGTLTLLGSSVSNNQFDGVVSQGGILTILNSTLSDNGRNVVSYSEPATLTVVNSTISGGEVGVVNLGQMTIRNSTIDSKGLAFETTSGDYNPPPEATFANTIVSGSCEGDVANHVTSNGYNIESPGNTCGFDQTGDQSTITAEQLNLEPLADNGGPTMTHALLTEPIVSVAVDVIPADDCVDAEGELLAADQRGEPRFVGLPFGPFEPVGDGCDVGSVEVQPAP